MTTAVITGRARGALVGLVRGASGYSFAMKRLSSVDAAFWFADTYQLPMNGASLMICDTSAASHFSFDAVRDLLAIRLRELPPLRLRVAGGLLGLDRPWFVEDPSVDVNFHVRRVAVPAPGGRRELEELVGRLMCYPLNRTRPLWELWYIEGVDHDRVAILTKIHHALVDGVSGTALFQAMCDNTAPPRPPTADAGQLQSAPGMPRFERRALAALFNVAIMTPYRVLRLAQQTRAQRRALRELADKPPRLFDAPPTRFNAELSPQRRISSSKVPVDRIKAVQRAFGVKFNDVVLALTSDAVRRYLQDRGELPELPLVAQIGISTRGDSTEAGNQVTSATVGLATHVANPAERLKTIYASTQGAKLRAKTLAAHHVVGLTETTPPGLFALAVRAYLASHIGSRLVPVNVVISNIPGPDFPLYVAGAVVEQQVPLGPLSLNVGLNITCCTYNGWAEFGFVTTPEIADDIDELANAIEPALQELERAAARRRYRAQNELRLAER